MGPRTGRALHHAIVWQDRRTTDTCARLKSEGRTSRGSARRRARHRSLLLGDEAALAARQRPRPARAGRVAARALRDDRLLPRLAAHGRRGARHRRLEREPHAALGPRRARVGPRAARPVRCPAERVQPEIVASSRVYADDPRREGPAGRDPVSGMAGDQQAALFGQACFSPARRSAPMARARSCSRTWGPSRCIPRAACSPPSRGTWGGGELRARGLLLHRGGSRAVAARRARAVQEDAGREALAKQVKDTGDLVFVPALAGLGAPHWRPEARASSAGSTGALRGAPRARHARGHRLPHLRSRGGHARGGGKALPGVQGGRRRLAERPAHAVPGGPARRARRGGRA